MFFISREFNNLKQKSPGLKTLLSIGGQFDNGDGFKRVSENDEIAQNFAQKAASWLSVRGFDGLDIDWEYPDKDTKRQFVRLLRVSFWVTRFRSKVGQIVFKWYISGTYFRLDSLHFGSASQTILKSVLKKSRMYPKWL